MGLFGRKRYILPIYGVMVAANVLFFVMSGRRSKRTSGCGSVGMMTSIISLTLVTTLLFLLRNVMDSAVTEVKERVHEPLCADRVSAAIEPQEIH